MLFKVWSHFRAAQFQIGDVIATDGSPISIKTKIDGKAQVDGSIKNLYHSLNGSLTGKVYFDIFLKKKDGKENVGSLTYYRFDVDASNLVVSNGGCPLIFYIYFMNLVKFGI